MIFAAWRPKLSGVKTILDIHDIMPEFFQNKFFKSERSFLVWALKLVEKLSAAMADHVIISNDLWLEKYTARSAKREKCCVFINHVDERIFHSMPRTRKGDRAVILFPGGLQWHQGLDIAIRAFHKLHLKMPNAEFHIYGRGGRKPMLKGLADDLGLAKHVLFFDPVSVEEIPKVIAEADLGVVPKRADSFGNEAYSTKIMEFMAVGIPVVVSATKIDRYYFNDSVVRFFEPGNPDALAEAMFEVLGNCEFRSKITKRASTYVADNCWGVHAGRYLRLVDSLIGSLGNVTQTVSRTHAS
jgi:glycosyltransferase involved in cell wall biosynthesis